MTTRMIHPLHGATHAYGPAEIAWHQDRGWEVEGASAARKNALEEYARQSVGPTLEPMPQTSAAKRRGRPPKAK